ncbi:hypothetical protein [Paracoccus sp. IB05]|uniref:hypothetical protein n=1 Tax=Paracoccus sp. IB05 TaxID=2779367 RepID=UPI0018E779AF|nr:hypothetical protein [Paracoccus sp. IB05]MBJ2150635.1 hypothetical protein [Paracoccus sp. IB05]
MTHYRSQIRAALKLALQVNSHFAGFTLKSAWAQNIDAETLPVMGVATPRETKDQDALDSAERGITAIIVLKRLGGDDLEEVLDDDSVPVENLGLATLRTLSFGAVLESTDIDIAGSAEQRIGTLTMVFRVVLSTPEPLTP